MPDDPVLPRLPSRLAVMPTTHGGTIVQSDEASTYFAPDRGEEAWHYFAELVHRGLRGCVAGNC